MVIERDAFLLFDGAMGTMLQRRGLAAGELPERLNLTAPEVVREIHAEYVRAGADVITANTFGANGRKFEREELREIITAGVRLAREAGAKYVALDVGPTGALLEPLGTMPFERAYELFSEVVTLGAEAGADCVLIETMADLYEARAAVLAAKESCELPVLCTMTFSDGGRTFLGADPETAARTLDALGVDALGLNCSLGPRELLPLVREMAKATGRPLLVQANAGLPEIEDGETVFRVTAKEYAAAAEEMLELGVTLLGGCCGTTPEFIERLRALMDGREPVRRAVRREFAVTSGQRTVRLSGGVAVIGERINPTGKKKLKEALRSGDFAYLVGEALDQQEAGADLLDVNCGLPELDEAAVLSRAVREIQGVSPLPLQIDSSDPAAVEAAVRIYNGKPMINSVNGKEESLEAILPIVKKYGAAVVGLTLDEDGIPDTAEGRFAVAEKIVSRAEALGIPREDIAIDCLVLTASTNQEMVRETLRAVTMVKERLGVVTVLGVSNVSFGLPCRELLNSAFLAAAFGAGLDLPILNPLSSAYMQVVDCFRVLNGQDRGSERYIGKYAGATAPGAVTRAEAPAARVETEENDIRAIILGGRKEQAEAATRALLERHTPMEVINDYFIPALDIVGEKFEKGEFFLPQLMASAETVKLGFDLLRENSVAAEGPGKGKILLATVKGDIHDIGKNIVKMLLQNYGYEIVDLGRDVDPALVVEETLRQGIKLVGLSALMTTTVKYMGDTVRALREAGANCKIMVGGAVLSPEYAELVGADYYAKDAAESARIAAEVLGG